MATVKELAIEAAKRIRSRMTHKARYMPSMCELRRGDKVNFGNIQVELRHAPMQTPNCTQCGTSLPAGPEPGPSSIELVSQSAAAIIERYFLPRLEAITAQIDVSDVITFDLPLPNGIDACDVGEYEGISVRVARIYDVAADQFLMRFDVLYCEEPDVALPVAA